MGEFRVKSGTKVEEFLTSNRLVDVLEGPLGSGKTKGLCAKPMRHAQEQRPSPKDGIRYTRFAMVRNTTPDLKRTTIRSWLELHPENVYGKLKLGAPMGHVLKYHWPGGDVHCEVDFLGLDKDDDIRKLRSGEYTGIGFDELEFIEKSLFDEARSRLRYPPQEHGGPTWRGVFAATNAPPEDHWLPQMTGRVELPLGLRDDEIAALQWPPSWGHHLQPAALIEQIDQHGVVFGYTVNPDAENLRNLPPGYYEEQIRGQTKAWIDSRLMVRVVLVTDGSPVYPMFRREVHVSREIIRPHKGYEVFVGADFGRSPAIITAQPINNRVQWQHELIGISEGAAVFAPKVKRFLAEKYPDHRLEDMLFFGDPKGQDKGQGDERTAFDIFRSLGMNMRSPPGLKQNMISTRVDALSSVLGEMTDGKPRFISSPMCRTFNVGMAGRYCNERDEEGELKPTKNRYSHVCNAAEYLAIGLGEGRRMVGLKPIGDMKAVQTHGRRRSLRRVEA